MVENRKIIKNEERFEGVRYITIDADFAEQRIDNYLFCFLKTVPKSRIYRLLRKGEIRVNKKRVDASYKLQTDDIVRLPPLKVGDQAKIAAPSQKTIALLKESVIYEDEHLLIINKPAGMAVHGGTTVRIGVVEAMRFAYPEIKQLELAHRLDADTSGVLVFGKRKRVLRDLHQLLRDGQVKKRYLALTQGKWAKRDLNVDVPLHKNALSSGKHMVQVDHSGKEALTIFETQTQYKQAALMRAHLHTGRTHQIRVHAAYRRHPIAGDDRYGDPEFNKTMRQLGLKRMFLHAERIEFVLPSSKKLICVTAPLDPDLSACLALLEKEE